MQQQQRNRILFYFLLFMPLSGINIVAYALLLAYFILYQFSNSKMHSIKGVTIAFLVITFFILKYLQVGDFDKCRIIIQYYFGVVLFLYYLEYSKTIILNIDNLIFILCAEIILEAVLVNTIIPPSKLFNYPEVYIQYSGYQRPLSIGCNTTVTATILCMLLAHRENLRKLGLLDANTRLDVVAGLTILVMASGMGIGLWALYFAYRMKGPLSYKNVLLVLSFILLLTLFLLIVPSIQTTIFQHLFGNDGDSVALTEFKEEEAERYLSLLDGFSLGLGFDFKSMSLLTQGDIAYLEMFLSIGIIGILLFVFIILLFINKYNWFPIVLGLIGIYHYGGIFSMPGQLVFGYLLLFNSDRFQMLMDFMGDKNDVVSCTEVNDSSGIV